MLIVSWPTHYSFSTNTGVGPPLDEKRSSRYSYLLLLNLQFGDISFGLLQLKSQTLVFQAAFQSHSAGHRLAVHLARLTTLNEVLRFAGRLCLRLQVKENT